MPHSLENDPNLLENPSQYKKIKATKSKSMEWKTFRKNKLGIVSFIILITMLLIAIAAPIIMPYDPIAQNVVNRAQGPSSSHWLGTDPFGRDILSRIILGSQTSLFVGFLSVAISSIAGGFIGMVAAYKGGWIDDILMRILESIMIIPMLLFGLMVLVALGSSMTTLIVVISIGLIPSIARVARGSTMEVKEKEYIKAAISLGGGNLRIMLLHIFPNILGPLLVMTTLNMSTSIRIEASLSFIGVGVQPPTPAWGNMIQEGFQYITSTPGLVIFPGLALLIVSIAFNILGDAIRDAFDPHIKVQRK
ncbi:ABC transporter permease [Neobacillus citreus]|uniref:ABC transporter permease n=1 Tax=Neobacillus citreus TaxID=2833578 RepID=A0A942T5C5_9BACI|nr:ABC transporter permease [Neobacillus citreus]MCH6266416.1 ABC transporter permease [Neobacillus citreus]